MFAPFLDCPPPIRAIGRPERPRILAHLLALDAHDRYLRFGHAASDERIRRYVDGLNVERDAVFGVFDAGLALDAFAHLAYSVEARCRPVAEFGVSVLPRARGRGLGAQLFDRAVDHARNEGVTLLRVHALSENATMLRIAQRAGARVERDGPEAEALLSLPPATFDTRVREWIDERRAAIDYHLKAGVARCGPRGRRQAHPLS